MEVVINFLNSPVGITLIVAIIVFALNMIYDKKPAWVKYEGWAIGAVKMAEKAIPDDTENKSLAKADYALKWFCKRYTEAKGKMPSKKLQTEMKQGISIVHAKLESDEILS